jgi:CDP-diacylglycerol--serine O-phosphatidyltransferase
VRDLRSVPVLPSLITLGNVFLGFLAMSKVADAVRAAGLGGPEVVLSPAVVTIFESAVILVFLAMVFDALDGRVARMTGQTSAFGAQLDSLADMVTFGVAPAFIAKVLINFHESPAVGVLPVHPKIYYFVAAVYVLCAAMRLARFNAETGAAEEDHTEFRGLPTPGAAALVCAIVAFWCSRNDANNIISRHLLPASIHDLLIVAMPATLVCIGLLMVSRVPYPHLFHSLLRRRHSFPFLATMVVLIGLAAVEWQLALLVLTVSYVAFGLGLGAYRFLTTGRMDRPRLGGEGEGSVAQFQADPERN